MPAEVVFLGVGEQDRDRLHGELPHALWRLVGHTLQQLGLHINQLVVRGDRREVLQPVQTGIDLAQRELTSFGGLLQQREPSELFRGADVLLRDPWDRPVAQRDPIRGGPAGGVLTDTALVRGADPVQPDPLNPVPDPSEPVHLGQELIIDQLPPVDGHDPIQRGLDDLEVLVPIEAFRRRRHTPTLETPTDTNGSREPCPHKKLDESRSQL